MAPLLQRIGEWRERVNWVYIPFEFGVLANLMERLARGASSDFVNGALSIINSCVLVCKKALEKKLQSTAAEQAQAPLEALGGMSTAINVYVDILADTSDRGRHEAGVCLIKLFDDFYVMLDAHGLLLPRPDARRP